ncbi:MAG: hypothetical protein PVG90_11280 [Bacillota bacterium]|jgi:hypothetical protein
MDANTWMDIIIVLLILLVYLFNRRQWFPVTAEISYEHLRSEAFLQKPPAVVPIEAGQGHPKLYGAIMEIGFPGAIATLITMTDGTANLYFSNGKGRAGKGKASQSEIREAALMFINQTQKYLPMLQRVDSFPTPARGGVRFYALSGDGVYSAEVPEIQLQKSASCLTFLYQYGYAVITQLGRN